MHNISAYSVSFPLSAKAYFVGVKQIKLKIKILKKIIKHREFDFITIFLPYKIYINIITKQKTHFNM